MIKDDDPMDAVLLCVILLALACGVIALADYIWRLIAAT